MKQIEDGLARLHSIYKQREGETDEPMREETKFVQAAPLTEVKIPFAWISNVIEGSPGHDAGF